MMNIISPFRRLIKDKRVMVTIISAIIFIMPTILNAQSVDSSALHQELELLKRRVDSLEVKYELMQINVLEKEPITSGLHLGKRKGFTMSWGKSLYHMYLDAGYSFLIRGNQRLALIVGHGANFGKDYELPDWDWYGKIAYGTPVFLNMLSLNTYWKAIFYDPASNDDWEQSAAYGFGGELEFWVTKQTCLTVGGDVTGISTDLDNNAYDQLYFSQVFLGVKHYFKFGKRKKS